MGGGIPVVAPDQTVWGALWEERSMRIMDDIYLYGTDTPNELRFLIEETNGDAKIIDATELVARVWNRYWYDETDYIPSQIYWWDPSFQGPRRVEIQLAPPVVRIVLMVSDHPETIYEDLEGLHDMDLVATGDPRQPWVVVRQKDRPR